MDCMLVRASIFLRIGCFRVSKWETQNEEQRFLWSCLQAPSSHPREAIADRQKNDDPVPPKSTSLDGTFSAVCSVLKLLVAHQPVGFSKQSDKALGGDEPTNLHTLLRMAVNLLG